MSDLKDTLRRAIESAKRLSEEYLADAMTDTKPEHIVKDIDEAARCRARAEFYENWMKQC